ncbi:hypothetical protein [Actinoplanes teichomyceticus]|uniref:Uncharacterized protein n=1 Tax=Actinoplanes teichomyceticus TaxID=1867 RepID=A0A561WIA6_ACTTI|nr:hypothetical protein [Actinoplanes teichomyceticus]TWG23585.1 hypothetical protein FHX34_102134 [Actinoplanes teichomyceticus]GIF16212.1 hypothetical protein Ate01nite_62440 [Actinoplanes teichomyceticus]
MRRREKSRPGGERLKPPRWIVHRVVGLMHFGGRDAEGALVLGDETRERLQSARDEWCRDNGCWRPGPSCAEAGEQPCAGRRAAS